MAEGSAGSGRAVALSRDRIVSAALTIADAEGLEAVSIRRVATQLGARTMTLYSHIVNKTELLDLLFDRLAGEVLAAGPFPAGWRAALHALGTRKRAVCQAHRWSVALYAQHPRLGPQTLRLLEDSVAALGGLTADPMLAWRAVNAVDDYTLGFLVRELASWEAPRRYGVSRTEWELSVREFRARVSARGDLPTLAGLIDRLESGPEPAPGGGATGDAEFERGLGWLLDGLAAAVARGR